MQVRGDKVAKAMEEVERREKLGRLTEMMERHTFHEKGFEKVRAEGKGGRGRGVGCHGIAVGSQLRM